MGKRKKQFRLPSLLDASVLTHTLFNQTGCSGRICCWTPKNILSHISMNIATAIVMPCEFYWSWLWQISLLILAVVQSTEKSSTVLHRHYPSSQQEHVEPYPALSSSTDIILGLNHTVCKLAGFTTATGKQFMSQLYVGTLNWDKTWGFQVP